MEQMDGEADWWTTSRKFGLPPLARVMGVGRQQQRKIVPMNYHVITKKLVKHLMMVKRTRQQVLITSKVNYIEHWEKVRLVSRHYQKTFQNIIDKDLKIKSWGKSGIRLIPKSRNRQPN